MSTLLLVVGVLTVVGGAVLATAPVTSPLAPCGSVISPGWDESVEIDAACDEAMSHRRWAAASALVAGGGLCTFAIVLRRHRRQNRASGS